VDKIPEDRYARLAFLEAWARLQQSRMAQGGWMWAEEIARVVAQARQRIGQVASLREAAAIPVVVTKPSDLPVDRAAVFADLMLRLREYKWADPVVSECDEPKYIAPNAIDLARRHRPDAPWLLYMEDDVILGPDFGLLPGLLREADELFPDTGLVSFFGNSVKPGWSTYQMDGFGWLQCAAIRNTDYLAGFRAFIDHGTTQGDKPLPYQLLPYQLPDTAVRMFLAGEYDAYALWYPPLVQHADVVSVFGKWRAEAHKQP
jgi:hypothetical protein